MRTLFFILLFTQTIYFYSQDKECDKLKENYEKQVEINKILLSKFKSLGVDFFDNELKVHSYSKDIVVNILRCEGDVQNQTVTIYFNVVNPNLPNQLFYLNGGTSRAGQTIFSQAHDEIGNSYLPLRGTLGAEKTSRHASDMKYASLSAKLTTGNNPLVGSITFMNILPNVQVLRRVDIGMNHTNLVGSTDKNTNRGITEVFNIPINWN